MSNRRKLKNKSAGKRNGRVTAKTRPPKVAPKAVNKTAVSVPVTPFGKDELPNVQTNYKFLSLVGLPTYVTGCGMRISEEGEQMFSVFKLNVDIPEGTRTEDELVAYLSNFLAENSIFAHPVPFGVNSMATLTESSDGDELAERLREILLTNPNISFYRRIAPVDRLGPR